MNNEISNWLQQGLPGAVVSVSGDGHHFEALIIWQGFEGKNALERHRLVYQALGNKMGREIHALSIHPFTPAEHKTE